MKLKSWYPITEECISLLKQEEEFYAIHKNHQLNCVDAHCLGCLNPLDDGLDLIHWDEENNRFVNVGEDSYTEKEFMKVFDKYRRFK